jgi:hypothetical protein
MIMMIYYNKWPNVLSGCEVFVKPFGDFPYGRHDMQTLVHCSMRYLSQAGMRYPRGCALKKRHGPLNLNAITFQLKPHS